MRKIIRNNLEYKLNFAKHIEEICQKATRKLYAIARLAPYMTPSKIHILTNVFYKFQFKYSPLIWMCCNRSLNNQKQSPRGGVLRERCSENIQQIYRRTLMPKSDFNKDAKQLYWNRTLAWVFSCKFAVYFQNTFF